MNSKLSLASNFAEPPAAGKMILALVEGAKAALFVYGIYKKEAPGPDVHPDLSRTVIDSAGSVLVALAQAYAPRMLEAGMEVPE